MRRHLRRPSRRREVAARGSRQRSRSDLAFEERSLSTQYPEFPRPARSPPHRQRNGDQRAAKASIRAGRARRVGSRVCHIEAAEAVRVVRAAADVALLSLPDISTEGQTAEDDEEREWPAPPECMNEVRHGSFPPYFVT